MTGLCCHSVLIRKDLGNILTTLIMTFDLHIKDSHLQCILHTV